MGACYWRAKGAHPIMPQYRIYYVGSDGHFSTAENIECADDQAAIRKARHAVNGQDIELCELGRFVARFSAPTINKQRHQ
jgi:hypothetical protein